MQFTYLEEELVECLEDIESTKERDLIVYNDDFNTFDHVIETLIKVCKHSAEQAEQCTWIIHYKGKCCVKKGTYKELKPMKDAISDAGIKVAIV
ncbi:ATP-dependent Clp protease adaptor ClpS [Fulvivirgaceae bacterium BMA10]|uniref:ATP-dependent Clp protease adaptor ClpS n=1 Tax=Splendidivirga corallicola TaxID=3051826 RepID=A0ABT8KKE3_9BACT|nr:ATP-dependent Clp protease adaptor ClpS [Fulvivirgaceae bacterium BMA10]